jgi:hypothetical protein
MGMGVYPAVKAFLSLNHPQGDQFSRLPEQVDVAVDRPQGKGRDGRLEPLVDPAGAGVGPGGPNQGQDLIPFFAVFFVLPLHPLGLFPKSIIITIIIIMNFGAPVKSFFRNFAADCRKEGEVL